MTYQYERPIAASTALRLHLNENTAGCSPRVLAALHALTRQDLAFYPDYDATIAACAERLGVPADRVLLTNGLDDAILATAVASLRNSPVDDPFEGIVIVPAFDMYAACIDAAGGRVVELPLGPGFAFPLRAVLDAIGPRTKAVFLTNPNNPTGGLIERDHVLAIARAARGAIVFIDEAYADFSSHTAIGDPDFATLSNVVVGRTFAKAYGLAGLRAGALVGNPDTLAPLRRTVPPYTLNVCAAAALPAALADVEYYGWYVEQVRESKALLYGALHRLEVEYWPSAANFVLANFGADLPRVLDGLARRGVVVRDRSRDPGCDGCARITTGVAEHTARCIAALEEVLCGVA
jgi:histidinol-phosphate aminotransferase